MRRVDYLSLITDAHNNYEEVDCKTDLVELLMMRHGSKWNNVPEKMYPFLQLIRKKLKNELQEKQTNESDDQLIIIESSDDETYSSEEENDVDMSKLYDECFNDVIGLSKRLIELEEKHNE